MRIPDMVRIGPATIALLVVHAWVTPATGQTYRFVALTHPEGTFAPTSINNACMVTGTLTEPDNSYHALVRHVSGRWVELPEMAGARSRAFGMNDLGHVGGWTLDGNGFGHAGVWRNGAFDEQDVPSGATTVPIAFDLNNKSEAVGYYRTTGNIPHAFFWDASGNVTKLPELSGGSSIAYAINESTEIVGAATLTGGTNHAVLWRKNSQTGNFEIQDLGSLGGPNSIAYDINNAGQVAGAAQDSPTTNRAFLWDGTTMQDMGTLGGANSGATAINDSGVIVGRSEVTALAGAIEGADLVTLSAISEAYALVLEGPPGPLPARPALHTAPAGPNDRAMKILPDAFGGYVLRNYNDRVPVDQLPLMDAFAINDSRAALVRDAADVPGMLMPFKSRNIVSLCSTPTGPCPEIDGIEIYPYSGLIAVARIVNGQLVLPFDLRYSSRPEFEHPGDGFGHGWTHGYRTHAAYFLSGDAELCHASGQIDLFSESEGTWEHRSNGQRDLFGPTGGGKVSSTPIDRNAAKPAQPEFVLYRDVENRFYFYGDTGNLHAVEDAGGNRLSFRHTGDRLDEVTDEFGNAVTLTYSPGTRVSQVSDGTRTFQFGYTDGMLTSITDPMGGVTSFEYDETHPVPGLLSSMTLPRGNTPYRFEYDLDGRLARVINATGGVWNFAYEPFNTGELAYPYRNHRTTITDPLGHTVTYVYDRTGDLLEVIDQQGSSITYAYDNLGLPAGITDRLGATSEIRNDPSILRPERVQEADGTSRQYTYSSRAAYGLTVPLLSTIVYSSGGGETYTYDANGNLTSFQDLGGGSWTFTYNANGQPLTATNPVGGTTTLAYNPEGTLATITDPAGNTTSLQYDALHRLIRAQGADGSQSQWSYDAMNRVVSSTDESGGVTKFVYDQNGNLIEMEDAIGSKWKFGYNSMDRVVSFTDALGAAAAFSYDALLQPTQATDRNGNSLTLAYGATGRLQGITDAGGNTWQFSTDAEGIITSTADPAGRTTSFTSDRLGRTTSITSGAATTTLTRDNLGRLTGVIGPDGWSSTRILNGLGLPDQITLPDGGLAVYAYDAAGQVAQATDAEGGAWSQQRDNQGRLMSRGDPVGGTSAYAHNTVNRISQVSLPGGLGTQTIAYDPVGNVTSRSYSDGTSFTYAYNAERRLTSMTGGTFTYDAAGRMTQSNGLAITRDPGGRITSMSLAPGRTVSYQYNSRNLVTRIEDWAGGVTQFDYDAVGRTTDIVRPNGVRSRFTYDADGRLTGIEDSGVSSIDLTYDLDGRVATAERTTPIAPDPPGQTERTFTFDAASRVESFTYDAAGRLLSDGSRTYTWNLPSQLTQYTEGGTTVTCTYDALGNRLTRSSGGVTHSFVWNYALDLPSISVVRTGGSDVRYFVHTPDGHLLYTVEASTGERHFYHFDEAGNSIALTDMQGSVAAAYAYTPFGEVLSSSGSVENAFTFGGRYGVQAEGRTGLYYMRARFYDAATARFVSRDPLQSFSPELLNPYQYALGNPLMVGDPTGLKPFDLPPSPQAPSPLRPQSEFSSREDFLKHYDEWSDQMDRWLKEVQERDRLIDELRKRHQEEFLKKWREGWEEYGRAVAESNAIILRQELLARGHSVTLQTVRLLQQDEGITSVEEFEDYLARGRAAAMAVHNQAMAAVGFAVQAHLASRREAAKPCPVPVSSGGLLNDSWVPGPEDVRLLRQERDEIKAGLGAIYRFFDFQWLR